MDRADACLRGVGVLGLASLAVLGMSACTTTLKVSKIDNFGSAAKGQVYYLPRAEYQIHVSRELTSCTRAYKDEAQAAMAWLALQFQAVRSADTPDKALALFDAIAADPILTRADVQPVVSAVLGANWQAASVSVPQPPRARAEKRHVIDDALQGLIDKIGRMQPQPQRELLLEVEMTAEAASSFLPDASHAYSLDYDPMRDGLKATDYAVETYPGGTLKSVNVTIDDQSGPALVNVIGGAAKIAASAGGFPLPALTGHAGAVAVFQPFADWQKEQSAEAACAPEIQLKLYQRAGLTAQSKANAKTVLAQQKSLDQLNAAQVKAIAARDKAKAALEELDPNDAKRIEGLAQLKKTEADAKLAATKAQDAKTRLTGTTEAADEVDKRLAAVRKALTVVSSTTFSPSASTLTLDLPGPAEALQAWQRPEDLGDCRGKPDCTRPEMASLAASLSAHAAIHVPSRAEAILAPPSVSGVFYRQPLRGTLLVCKAQACTSGNAITAKPDAVLISSVVDVPQLGAFAVLPLKNGPFQNNTITASFAESGALTKVTYKSNAAAAKAAEVFESSADTLMKFREAKRNQETSKLAASASELEAQKKVVDAQLALEKAQADLQTFRESKSSPSAD